MTEPKGPLPSQWRDWRSRVDLDEYDKRWKKMAASGQNPHGEADLVTSYQPTTVLDAGCGMGRVGIELARRGMTVVGVDLDPDMLERARANAPQLSWLEADLATLDDVLSEADVFDVIVMAGNVIPFIAAESRAAAVASCARHLGTDGRLIVGFKLEPGWPTLDEYDGWSRDAGLTLEDRWSTWDRAPFDEASTYCVSVQS